MGSLLYLRRREVAALLPSATEQVELVERALRAFGRGDVQMPPKPSITPSPDTFIHAMPAFVADGAGAAGIKWIGGSSRNRKRGLPYLSGVIVLNDPESAAPIAILDAAEITATRTAAVSALCIQRFVGPKPCAIAVIGCGEQGSYHARFLRDLFGARIVVFDRHHDRAADIFGAIPAESARDAVAGAEVVVTAVPLSDRPEWPVEAEWLRETKLVLPIDFAAGIPPEAISAIPTLIVDSDEQYDYFRGAGHFTGWPSPTTTLAEALDRRIVGRVACCNLGIGAIDVVFAARVLAAARQQSVGVQLEM